MTEKEVLEILSMLEDSKTKKRLSEIITIENIVYSDNLLKLRLNIPEVSIEEKQILRKSIENIFADEGIDVLVSISSTEPEKPSPKQELIPMEIFNNFKKIIAVHSAKGGVGKSTVSVALAGEFAELGLKTALIDLDIYGPSVPRMLGLTEQVSVFNDKFVPAEIDGIHMMSIGILLPEMSTPLIWRAPIVNGVIKQIFTDTAWDNDYDVLVIDMPPGTGDIPIAVCQSIPLDGILTVSTPQGVALEDTIKGISMFAKFNHPILGFVYNMGSVVCPDCHRLISIFPQNSEFEELFNDYGIDVVASLPLDAEVSQAADKGWLIKLSEDLLWKKEFSKITNKMKERLKL